MITNYLLNQVVSLCFMWKKFTSKSERGKLESKQPELVARAVQSIHILPDTIGCIKDTIFYKYRISPSFIQPLFTRVLQDTTKEAF